MIVRRAASRLLKNRQRRRTPATRREISRSHDLDQGDRCRALLRYL